MPSSNAGRLLLLGLVTNFIIDTAGRIKVTLYFVKYVVTVNVNHFFIPALSNNTTN